MAVRMQQTEKFLHINLMESEIMSLVLRKIREVYYYKIQQSYSYRTAGSK